jgi:hypothetical protein
MGQITVMRLGPFSSFQRKLESSDFEAERHWIPAFAGMTSRDLRRLKNLK